MTFQTRLQAYLDQTRPLVSFYEGQRKLVEVDGMAPIDEVARQVDAALETSPA